MKTRAILTLGLSVLALGGTIAGVATQVDGMAFASARSESHAERQAVSNAAKAQKALGKGETGHAMYFAEAAVGLRPQVASFRVLLGSSYLKAGRFDSARQAFADALTLEPGNAKAALNLALTQIATGDWTGARATLDAHQDSLQVSDRGLAIALAGDPAGAVELLSVAARKPDADAKTRQNLALSLALAGRWQEAKTMAALDMSPADVDQRIMQWAAFARPKSAYDQVASLLGVTPVQDSGQPAALALNGNGPALAAKAADPIDKFMPGNQNATVAAQDAAAPAAPVAAPVPEAVVADAAAPVEVATAAPAPAPAFSGVSFGPRQEVVQSLPVRTAAVVAPVRVAKAAPGRAVSPIASARMPAKGSFFVQLGAYENAGVARDAWGRIKQRDASFGGHTPSGVSFASRGGSFYRLSVGGFARGDADALCNGYKAKGGTCFVRPAAGDQAAAWPHPGRQIASR